MILKLIPPLFLARVRRKGIEEQQKIEVVSYESSFTDVKMIVQDIEASNFYWLPPLPKELNLKRIQVRFGFQK
ncbi:unnamed protein product [Prunus brigantina]